MSATTATALKTIIEGAALGLAAYRDRAPTGTRRPYVTITEDISNVPERHGDHGDPDADQATTELVQVDLWSRLKTGNPDDYDGNLNDPYEDPALIRGLHLLLNGGRADTAPTRIYGITVDDYVRLVEHDRGVVHHAFTVRVRRAVRAISA